MNFRLIILFLFFSGSIWAQEITVKDIWTNYRFYSTSKLNDNFFDGENLLKRSRNGLEKVDLDNESRVEVVNFNVLPDTLVVADFELSPSKKMLLLNCNSEPLYRRSKKSYVIIYDLEKSVVRCVTSKKVFNPSFSPDEKRIAYTYENNIYVKDLTSGVEKKITKDGEWNKVLNGRTDWVYEEEFGFTQAYTWVPESNSIAYLKFNETDVKTYNMQMWGSSLYPELYSYKYPKAGEVNSKVSLRVVDVISNKDVKIGATSTETEYFTKILPTKSSSTFFYLTNNRLQNDLKAYLFNVKKNETKLIYEEKSAKYVENPEDPLFTETGMIIDSYKSGFKHFYEIEYESGVQTDLTPGDFDVTKYHGFSTQNGSHYFSALYDNSYTQSLCSQKKGKVKKVVQTDKWVSSSFSPDMSWVQIETSSLDSRNESETVFFKLKDKKGLETYSSGEESGLDKYNLGETEFMMVKSKAGHEIPAYVIYPPGFDKTKKYPLLMHCYGGPGHQVVVNKWNSFDYFYHQMLAQKGCVVVLADGRGTDGKGKEYRQASYGDFGKYEHEDQVEVAQYFRNKSFIDSNRVGIWGWSFGGYLSSLCLLKSPDVFSMAVAVAPVTNWRFYDNIYTERYMGLPSSNSSGYDENSPTTYAKNLKGKFLLIHGTGDDNVHIQNSIFLQNELLKHNKQFETFYYPDKTHGIYGGNTRYNLYKKMTNFIEQNLIKDGY